MQNQEPEKVELTTFDYVCKILNSDTQNPEYPIPKTLFYESVASIVKKQYVSLRTIKDFFKHLNQQRNCLINIESAMRYLNGIQFIVCKEKTLYNFDPERRGYCITGKSLNVYKRVKKNQHELLQDRQARDQLISEAQQTVFRLYHQGKYPLQRWQRGYQIEDLLMQYDLPGTNLEPVYLSNQVFPPFVVLQPTVVMTISEKIVGKADNLQFLRSSMLHIYLDYDTLLSRISSRLIMHKNTVLKGVNFIEQGEVQVKSGRIVARGWVTSGVCRNSGSGWKFKPLSFIKFLAKNENVWKQYLNDIKINGEYPFQINAFLAVSEDGEDDDYSLPFRSYSKRNQLKLPKLNSGTVPMAHSFDFGKYIEIEKLRHYDQKLDEMFYYKKDILMRKMKGKKYNKYEPLIQNAELQAAKKAHLKRQLSKQRRDFTTVKRNNKGSENILIMSVLKRLESLAVEQEVPEEKGKKISLRMRLESKPNLGKMTPLQSYELKRKNAQSRLAK